MELLMENKEKVTDDYLFNLNFTVLNTGLKMLCPVIPVLGPFEVRCSYGEVSSLF